MQSYVYIFKTNTSCNSELNNQYGGEVRKSLVSKPGGMGGGEGKSSMARRMMAVRTSWLANARSALTDWPLGTRKCIAVTLFSRLNTNVRASLP